MTLTESIQALLVSLETEVSVSAPDDQELSELCELSPPVVLPDRSVWRNKLPGWSIAQREQWGRRANELQDQGEPWNVAEWRAFQEMTTEGYNG